MHARRLCALPRAPVLEKLRRTAVSRCVGRKSTTPSAGVCGPRYSSSSIVNRSILPLTVECALCADETGDTVFFVIRFSRFVDRAGRPRGRGRARAAAPRGGRGATQSHSGNNLPTFLSDG